jgi:hypothetical protein
MMLPITLDLARVPVALVGRDAQALKRLRQLEADGVPRTRIFSDAPSEALRAFAGERLIERLPTAADLAGSRVVFIADMPHWKRCSRRPGRSASSSWAGCGAGCARTASAPKWHTPRMP